MLLALKLKRQLQQEIPLMCAFQISFSTLFFPQLFKTIADVNISIRNNHHKHLDILAESAPSHRSHTSKILGNF